MTSWSWQDQEANVLSAVEPEPVFGFHRFESGTFSRKVQRIVIANFAFFKRMLAFSATTAKKGAGAPAKKRVLAIRKRVT